LIARLEDVELHDGFTITWSLNKDSSFTVWSMCRYLSNSGIKVSQEIWKMNLPLKIKKNLYVVSQNKGSTYHCFCSNMDTIQHVFFKCCYAKFLWRTLCLCLVSLHLWMWRIYLVVSV